VLPRDISDDASRVGLAIEVPDEKPPVAPPRSRWPPSSSRARGVRNNGCVFNDAPIDVRIGRLVDWRGVV